jgi:enterochelin esterase family protein
MHPSLVAALIVAASPAADPCPFQSLAALDAGLAGIGRGAPVEPFWEQVKACGRMPLVYGDVAVFLHRSDADRVEWRGDWNSWRTAPDAGQRVGASDVWTFRRSFEQSARLDYKLVEIREAWVNDPQNPHRQLGGYGPNSELRMPGWTPPAHVVRRPGVPAGELSPPLGFRSEALGAEVVYRVYRPAGAPPGPLPILYVTDGSDYWHPEMGALDVTLDNLIAEKRIEPLLAVFVDSWDASHEQQRREGWFIPERGDRPFSRCPYCTFLAEELGPAVEQGLPVDPARRGILGMSWGGLNAAYMTYRYPDRFPRVGLHSPAIEPAPWLPGVLRAQRLPSRRVAITTGRYERFTEGGRRLREAFEASGARLLYREVPDGHSWGHWRATAADILEFLYPPPTPPGPAAAGGGAP